MTLDQIKQALAEGKRVHWANDGYEVIRDNIGQYLIIYEHNGSAIGLTHMDGVSLNGIPSEFYIS